MTFDDLVDRLMSLYDATETRAAAVVNERLQRMASESKGIRKSMSLGTTVSGTASYTLDTTVLQVLKVRVVYAAGQVNYEGVVSIDDMWDLDSGDMIVTTADMAYFFAVEPDTDNTATTDLLRLYPAPEESGKTITGLVAIQPATITYGSSTALPIPLEVHEYLLAGCKAELSDEESRQDESAGFEASFGRGIQILKERAQSRGVGSGRHRMRVAGYDLRR